MRSGTARVGGNAARVAGASAGARVTKEKMSQRSEVGGQRSAVGGPKSDVRGQKSEGRHSRLRDFAGAPEVLGDNSRHDEMRAGRPGWISRALRFRVGSSNRSSPGRKQSGSSLGFARGSKSIHVFHGFRFDAPDGKLSAGVQSFRFVEHGLRAFPEPQELA